MAMQPKCGHTGYISHAVSGVEAMNCIVVSAPRAVTTPPPCEVAETAEPVLVRLPAPAAGALPCGVCARAAPAAPCHRDFEMALGVGGLTFHPL